MIRRVGAVAALVMTSVVITTVPAVGAPGDVITVPTAYCSGVVSATSTEYVLFTEVPLHTPWNRSKLRKDSRWAKAAYPRATQALSDYEGLRGDAAGTAFAPLVGQFTSDLQSLVTKLVKFKHRLGATIARRGPIRHRSLDRAVKSLDTTGKLAWSALLSLNNAYSSLCFGPQYVLATLQRIPPFPDAISATTLTNAAQAESATITDLTVSVLTASPTSGPVTSASLSVSLGNATMTIVAPVTVCLAFPSPGTAPAEIVQC